MYVSYTFLTIILQVYRVSTISTKTCIIFSIDLFSDLLTSWPTNLVEVSQKSCQVPGMYESSENLTFNDGSWNKPRISPEIAKVIQKSTVYTMILVKNPKIYN